MAVSRTDLLNAGEDELIQVIYMALIELEGRYRQTRQNTVMHSAIRIMKEHMAEVEAAKEHLDLLAATQVTALA